MKTVSCGLIVVSPKGWLLAHATNSDRWDLPKGRPEEGETFLETAVREGWEETNLNFSPFKDQMEDLGRFSYIPNKDLYLFRLTLPEAWPLDQCACHTYVEWENGHRFPETDRWDWVPEEELLTRVGKGLGTLLIEHGFLPNPGKDWWKQRLKQKALSV